MANWHICEGFKTRSRKINNEIIFFFFFHLSLKLQDLHQKGTKIKTVEVTNVKDLDKYNEAVVAI